VTVRGVEGLLPSPRSSRVCWVTIRDAKIFFCKVVVTPRRPSSGKRIGNFVFIDVCD